MFDDSGNGGSAVSHWGGFAHIGLDLRAEREGEEEVEGNRQPDRGGREGKEEDERGRGKETDRARENESDMTHHPLLCIPVASDSLTLN